MSHDALDELADDLGQLCGDPGAADDLRAATRTKRAASSQSAARVRFAATAR
jgi:hypothetical protein